MLVDLLTTAAVVLAAALVCWLAIGIIARFVDRIFGP